VTLTRSSTLQEVAAVVGMHLASRGIRAVLTGGACVAIHTGTHVSKDADFVLQGNISLRTLDAALRELGFARRGAEYIHPDVPFTVEFPPGPLSIGEDLAIVPVDLTVGSLKVLGLSATDSCRDRLAAFFHWNDRQSLALAVEIARSNPVDMAVIRAWSRGEGRSKEFEEFLRKARRPDRGTGRRPGRKRRPRGGLARE